MKIMIAKCCGELVVPSYAGKIIRYCVGERSAVIWDNPQAGKLAIWSDVDVPTPEVLGIANNLLDYSFPPGTNVVGKTTMKKLIGEHDKISTWFRMLDSLIFRVAPKVSSGDIRIAETQDFE